MYKLEINLLRDRYLQEKIERPSKVGPATPTWEKQAPLIIGGAVMLLLPALAAGGIWFISWQAEQTQEQIDSLDIQLNRLKTRTRSLALLQAEIKQINGQTTALVGVFNYIKPWSAILKDISSRTPLQLQITSIQEQKVEQNPNATQTKQEQNPKAKESPNGSPVNQETVKLPPIGLTIQGYARTYQDVNDFVLSLQASKFLIPEATAITSAKLVDLPIKVVLPSQQEERGEKNQPIPLKFPKVIQYTIETALTQVPPAQLLGELKNQGARGLEYKLRNLPQKGAIEP